MEANALSLKQSSIEVNKTSKGDFSFSIKLYFDDDRKASDEIISEIRNIMTELEKRFK